MCTALTLKTKDGKHVFGRNLDVTKEYGQKVIIIPRKFIPQRENFNVKYAIISMGIVLDKHPFIFDGVNEKGFAGAGLNFTYFAEFSKKEVEGKINLCASDFLYWALSSFKNLEELKESLENVVLTNIPAKEGLEVAKLHWIFTDLTGKSIVIEYVEEKMYVYENHVGVLTNDPPFDWQLINLSQFVPINTKTPKSKSFGEFLVEPYGHGLNMLGLPGDFSPASRFVRTCFFKFNTFDLQDEVSGVNGFFKILDNVFVIKGSEVDESGDMNYTLYQSAICQENCTYYYRDYNNSRVNAICLFNENLDCSEIKKFDFKFKQDIYFQN